MLRQSMYSALVLGTILAGSHSALAENRVALVIGESAYRSVTPLPNPANDAKAVAKLLADSGFEVTTASDLSREEMNGKVGDFAATIAAKGPDTVALVFYAGHGLQIDGENFLVPVDVDPRREADIPLQAVRLNDVLNTLNAVPSKMRILLLDACRNNPFPDINQTAGRGLAMIDAKSGAPGTFVSFSTSPGAEAEDGTGADSPYTTALLSTARTPGLPIEQAFKQVRLAVNKATDGRQTPWDSSSLTDDFEFIAGAGAHASAPAVPKMDGAKRSVDDWRRLLQGKPVEVAHDMIVEDGTLEAYQAFVALYAQSRFASEAHQWILRTQRMLAWDEAVTFNTAASYRAFLAEYPDSDLAATARKLIERLRYKPSVMPAVVAAQPGNVALGNCNAPTPPAPPKKVELAPTNPAPTQSTTPVIVKKVEITPPPRDPEPPVRTVVLPRPVQPPVVVYRRPQVFAGPVGVRMGFAGGMGGPIGFIGRRRF
ncbi:MAG TPA: caspase family protein [Xanthobacteraceae bacterium]